MKNYMNKKLKWSFWLVLISLIMVGQRVNAGLSGSSGRSLLLLVTNIALLTLGALTVASGSIMLTIFLFHLLTFASSLFLVTPIILMTRLVILIKFTYNLISWNIFDFNDLWDKIIFPKIVEFSPSWVLYMD